MKGNWVFSKRFQRPVQIVAVASRVLYYVDGVLRTENVGDVSPIHLTPEILEKNGFVPDNFSPYYLPIEDGSIRFSKHQYGLYCNILLPYQRYDGVCNYVHQLQHALRLCGIEKEIVI